MQVWLCFGPLWIGSLFLKNEFMHVGFGQGSTSEMDPWKTYPTCKHNPGFCNDPCTSDPVQLQYSTNKLHLIEMCSQPQRGSFWLLSATSGFPLHVKHLHHASHELIVLLSSLKQKRIQRVWSIIHEWQVTFCYMYIFALKGFAHIMWTVLPCCYILLETSRWQLCVCKVWRLFVCWISKCGVLTIGLRLAVFQCLGLVSHSVLYHHMLF